MIIQSIILGIIQGLTEFLPVSSSGHLVIFESILNISTQGALFEAVLHLGTMLAVVVFFRSRIKSLSFAELKLLAIGTIPVVIVGLLFKDQIEALFDSTKLVGIALIVTGVINFLIDRQEGRKEKLDFVDAIVVGAAQSFAIIPGISRSGSTILAARSSRIDATKAAEFSFLLSVPAIIGANVLQITTHGFGTELDISFFVVGFVASFISGLVAISLVLGLLKQKRFKIFGAYAIVVGLAAIFLI